MENCEWKPDSDEEGTIWNTTCGHAFQFETGSPLNNDFAYCPYCGRKLTQRAADGFSAWAGDDDQGDGIGFAEVHGW